MLQNKTHQVPSLVHSSVTFLNSDVMQCVLLIFPGSVPPKGAALSMQVNLNIHSHQSHPWTNSPQWISLISKMSWLSKFIAVAFFVLYFVEKGASVQKLKPIKWATATAKWDEISANCHKHRNGENQKMGYFSTLITIQPRSVSRQMLNKERVNVKYLESAADSCSHWDAIAAESKFLTCTLTSLQFTTSRYTMLHVLTSLLPSASPRRSSAVSKGERDMLVGWRVLVGDTTASKVPTFPNPRNPEGQPQALL